MILVASLLTRISWERWPGPSQEWAVQGGVLSSLSWSQKYISKSVHTYIGLLLKGFNPNKSSINSISFYKYNIYASNCGCEFSFVFPIDSVEISLSLKWCNVELCLPRSRLGGLRSHRHGQSAAGDRWREHCQYQARRLCSRSEAGHRCYRRGRGGQVHSPQPDPQQSGWHGREGLLRGERRARGLHHLPHLQVRLRDQQVGLEADLVRNVKHDLT